MPESCSPPLVICFGNPDCGDDAAGSLVARRLREAGIVVHEHRGDALALLDTWRAEDVILVDAVVTGKRPGSVTVWDGLPVALDRPAAAGFSHGLGLSEAIAISQSLGCAPRRLTIYGIEARCFELGQPPSQAILRGVARASQKIYEYCVDQRVPAV